MTTIRPLSTLVLIVACLAAWATPALAQETPPTLYLRLDYMDVEPAKEAAYLDMEEQIWKPIHQELIRAGVLVAWHLYAVRLPGGTGHDYNYVTVNVYDDLADVGDPYPVEVLTRVHEDADLAELVDQSYAARDLVRSELWVMLDQAADTVVAPSRYALIDYKHVQPDEEENYIRDERETWKGLHQERMQAGTISNWGVYALVLPGGNYYGYNYGTVNFFESLTALEDFYPEDLLRQAAPEYSGPVLPHRVYGSADVRSELWELIDSTE